VTAQLDVQITPDLGRLSARLKSSDLAGGNLMKRELAARLRKVGDKVVEAERAAIQGATVRGVKRGGGLRVKRGGSSGHGQGIRSNIANAIMRRNRMTGKEQGVEVRVSKGKMPAGMGKIPFNSNRGSWRHPIFGNRNAWAEQRVSPTYWWTRTAKQQGPAIEAEIKQVIAEFVARADRELSN